MRRGLFLFCFVILLACPCHARSGYQIEVLQIGSADVYETAYDGLLDGLARQGLVKDCNATISRTIMDTSPEPSLWERFTKAFRIRYLVSSIIDRHPDLVITLGTQATEAFSDRIRDAGIPVVFSGVCPSGMKPGSGMTGVLIRPQPSDMIKTIVLTLPGASRIGIIRTPDIEAARFAGELTRQAGRHGMTVIEKEIDEQGSVAETARGMIAGGIDAFIIPTDSSYEAEGWKAFRDLIAEADRGKVPCISALVNTTKGPLITLAPDFEEIGNLTAKQVSEILTQGRNPGELAVISHSGQNFIVDLNASRQLGISFRPRTNSLFSLMGPGN